MRTNPYAPPAASKRRVGHDWRCPCCDRTRDEVKHVHRHHDHGSPRRFPRTLVCSACNASDTAAKRALGLPLTFSFSPDEIACFVERRDRDKHAWMFEADEPDTGNFVNVAKAEDIAAVLHGFSRKPHHHITEAELAELMDMGRKAELVFQYVKKFRDIARPQTREEYDALEAEAMDRLEHGGHLVNVAPANLEPLHAWFARQGGPLGSAAYVLLSGEEHK